MIEGFHQEKMSADGDPHNDKQCGHQGPLDKDHRNSQCEPKEKQGGNLRAFFNGPVSDVVVQMPTPELVMD